MDSSCRQLRAQVLHALVETGESRVLRFRNVQPKFTVQGDREIERVHRVEIELVAKIDGHADNELSAPDRRTIERHLRDCPCCEDVLDSLKQTVALCHDEGRPDLPADVRQRARARVAELLTRTPARRTRVR